MPTKPKSKRRPWLVVRQKQSGRKVRDPRYDTRRWRQIRLEGLSREPFCAECERKGKQAVPATVRDHILPVNEGGSFWGEHNHQSLCGHCHNVKSGRERWHGGG